MCWHALMQCAEIILRAAVTVCISGRLKRSLLQCVFVAQLSIGDEELEQTLEAKNTGDKPFELTAALHTYIAVSSIEKVQRPNACSLPQEPA